MTKRTDKTRRLRKNAYRVDRKKHQAGRPHNYQTTNRTANKIPFPGLTWHQYGYTVEGGRIKGIRCDCGSRHPDTDAEK